MHIMQRSLDYANLLFMRILWGNHKHCCWPIDKVVMIRKHILFIVASHRYVRYCMWWPCDFSSEQSKLFIFIIGVLFCVNFWLMIKSRISGVSMKLNLVQMKVICRHSLIYTVQYHWKGWPHICWVFRMNPTDELHSNFSPDYIITIFCSNISPSSIDSGSLPFQYVSVSEVDLFHSIRLVI